MTIWTTEDICQLFNSSLVLWMADNWRAKALRIVWSTKGAFAWHWNIAPTSSRGVCYICAVNIKLYIAWYSEICRITFKWFWYHLALIKHTIHLSTSSGCVAYWVSQTAFTIFPILLVISEQNFCIINSCDLLPSENSTWRLAIHFQAFCGIFNTILGGVVPTIHVVLTFKVTCASFLFTFLFWAHASEGPIDIDTAIATCSAVRMWIAILVFNQT